MELEFNIDNLRLRYKDTYSFLGRLCEEYDRSRGEHNWFPDPLTGEGHWMYGDDRITVELTIPNPDVHEVEIYEARLGMFYLTPSVRKHHDLTVEQMEELFFLNTLALLEPENGWAKFNELMGRIRNDK